MERTNLFSNTQRVQIEIHRIITVIVPTLSNDVLPCQHSQLSDNIPRNSSNRWFVACYAHLSLFAPDCIVYECGIIENIYQYILQTACHTVCTLKDYLEVIKVNKRML